MENWTKIKGYEGLYCISDFGRVWSVNIGVMSFSKNSAWYRRFNLSKKGKRVTVSVHRLVAEYFIPNPYNLPEVNHIDGNKTNCHRDNLEWVTKSDNAIHCIKVLGRNQSHHPKRKKLFSAIKDGNKIDCVGIRETGRLISIPYQAIQQCLKKERETYCGWTFVLKS